MTESGFSFSSSICLQTFTEMLLEYPGWEYLFLLRENNENHAIDGLIVVKLPPEWERCDDACHSLWPLVFSSTNYWAGLINQFDYKGTAILQLICQHVYLTMWLLPASKLHVPLYDSCSILLSVLLESIQMFQICEIFSDLLGKLDCLLPRTSKFTPNYNVFNTLLHPATMTAIWFESESVFSFIAMPAAVRDMPGTV